MDLVYFIGLIAIGTVVYLIVGWIGNKAVDKTENAMRARRVQKQRENPASAQPSRRLADQLTPRAASQAAQQTTAFPGSQPSAQPVTEQKARFCAECGAALAENAKFCPMCGAAAESYRSRE